MFFVLPLKGQKVAVVNQDQATIEKTSWKSADFSHDFLRAKNWFWTTFYL